MNQQISKLIAVQAFCVFTLAPLPRNTLTMPTYPLASKRKFASMRGVAWRKWGFKVVWLKPMRVSLTEPQPWQKTYPILFKATTVTCLHTHLLSMAYSGGLDLRQIWNTISYHWANGVRMRKGDCMFPQSNKWNFQWSMSCWSVQSTPIRYYTWKEFNYYYWPQPLNYQLEIVLIEQSLQAKAILTSVRELSQVQLFSQLLFIKYWSWLLRTLQVPFPRAVRFYEEVFPYRECNNHDHRIVLGKFWL